MASETRLPAKRAPVKCQSRQDRGRQGACAGDRSLEGSKRWTWRSSVKTTSWDRLYPNNRFAMISYWISVVPSKIRNSRASRQNRCAGNSRL